MNKVYGNADIQEFIDNYLKQEKPGGITFLGPKGIGKYLIASNIAAELLNCEIDKLTLHPDYIIIKPDGGSIKIGQIQLLQKVVFYYPSRSSRRVILIDDADSMTVSSQNCLLKILEDKQDMNVFLFVAHSSLLPTIHSRTSTVTMKGLSHDEMLEYLSIQGLNSEDAIFYVSICDGSIGTYRRLKDETGVISAFKKCVKYFETCSERNIKLLKLFHLYKEKDSYNFYELFKDEIDSFFYMIMNLFYGLFLSFADVVDNKCDLIDYSNMKKHYNIIDTIYILEQVKKHRLLLKNRSYSKNDFFDFVRSLISTDESNIHQF